MADDTMLIVAVLFVTVLMRAAIVLAAVYLLLPAGALCPHCKAEMLPIRNRFLAAFLPALERRWCVDCGWNGIVRRARRTPRRTERPRSVTPS